jgi:acyl carrier protein
MQRIERVEQVLLADSAVQACLVLRLNQDQIVAYVTPAIECTRDLLQRLESALPPQLLPEVYVSLTEMPIASDGQIDVSRLLQCNVLDPHVVRIERIAAASETWAPVQQEHQIAGQRLWSPALQDAVFESRVSPAENPLLQENGCDEFAVVPAGWLVSAAIDAVQRALGCGDCCLEDLSFESPVALRQQDQRIVQVILTLGEVGEMFKIVSRDGELDGDEAWTDHAIGSIGRFVDAARPAELQSEVRQRWQQSWTEFTGEQLYETLSSRAVHIGDSYRAITTGWNSDSEVLCQLHLSESACACAFHPALLASCVHALIAVTGYDAEQVLAPMGVERAQFFDAPQTTELWCWLRLRESQGDRVVADAAIYDEGGRALIAFESLYFDKFCTTQLLGVWRANTESTRARSASQQRSEFLEQLEAAPMPQRSKMVCRLVNELTCHLLGRDAVDALDPQQGFFDAGMTSLTVMDLVSRLERALGRSLPAALAFTYSTPEQLAEHLCQDVLEIETDESAQVELGRTSELDELSEAELASRLSEKLKNLARGTG